MKFTDEEKELITQLVKIVNDPTDVRLSNFKIDNSIVVEDDSIAASSFHDSEKYKSRYIGTIIFSNPIILDEKACYYLQINCDNNCSAGFLVFAKKVNGHWIFLKDQMVFGS